ncbi:hypothetical protein P3X46_024689 [Hevea brasiliensis]|uniref:PGG domain-containing protein n=2 Tax=Hevea brasiliensis TaxID=3981 RepID=A0ABQ9L6J7_HEVBR|nr:hypothetical protein P3X46_024689 [Hevea brasiliensis]
MDSSNSQDVTAETRNFDDPPAQTEIISCMDPNLLRAAAEGIISPFNGYDQPLDLLVTPNKNTVLHIYISARANAAKSFEFMCEILQKCPSLLDQANIRDETPLHFAARYGHDDIAEALIEHAEAQHDDLERGAAAVREMLRKMNTEKDTALHEAVRYNHLNVVRRLLSKEDVDYCYLANAAGESPLYLAAERGYGDILSEILETCTSPEYNGPNGRTALHEAVINNDAEMTRRILRKTNTDLTKKIDQQGWTPLHHASHFGHLSIVNLLLDADKSAAYIGDEDGKKTPLHIAASKGDRHVEVMKSIVSHCPDCCELVDDRGRNVLHFAVESYRSKGLRALLQNSFMSNLINQKDNKGNTPLHFLAALRFNCKTLIRQPLVDMKAINKENLTALDIVLATTDNVKVRLTRRGTIINLRTAGCKRSRRNKIIQEDNSKSMERVEGMISELKKAKDSHLIVATLIATVTFAAGFTIPGGYISDKGTAVLSKKAAFQVFLLSNGFALVFSTSVVLIQFMLAMQGNKRKFFQLFSCASWLTIIATILMVVAFTTGTYVALPSSYRNITWIFVGSFLVSMLLILRASLPLSQVRTGDLD